MYLLDVSVGLLIILSSIVCYLLRGEGLFFVFMSYVYGVYSILFILLNIIKLFRRRK